MVGDRGAEESLILTCLASVAVLALDEAPAAAGENGIPNAHCRRRISRIPTLSVSSSVAGAAEQRFLGRAAGAGYLELEFFGNWYTVGLRRCRLVDGEFATGQSVRRWEWEYAVVFCQCQGSSIFCLFGTSFSILLIIILFY